MTNEQTKVMLSLLQKQLERSIENVHQRAGNSLTMGYKRIPKTLMAGLRMASKPEHTESEQHYRLVSSGRYEELESLYDLCDTLENLIDDLTSDEPVTD